MPHVSTSRRARASRRGAALLAVATALVVVVVLLVACVGLTVDSYCQTERRIDVSNVRAGADTATTLAVESLWTELGAAEEGAGDQMLVMRTFLDGLGIVDQARQPSPSDVELLPRLDLATDKNGAAAVDGTVIESVRVRRIDEPLATRLEFATTVVARGGDVRLGAASMRRTVQDVFVIEPSRCEGRDCVPRSAQVDGPMSCPLPCPDDGGTDPVERNDDRGGRGEVKSRSTERLSIQRRLWAADDDPRRGAESATLPR